MCSIDWADPWDFYTERHQLARKAHPCCECGRTIVRRERYHYAMGRLDNVIYTYRQCGHCDAAGQWLRLVCGGYLYDGLLTELEEHWSDSPELRSITLARLIAGMRHKWFDGRASIPELSAIENAIPRSAYAFGH